MSVLTVYLGLEDKGIWLDSPLGTVGDRGTITVDSEQMAVVYGFGTTYLFVERGDAETSHAPHQIGATVTASVGSGGNPAALSRLRVAKSTAVPEGGYLVISWGVPDELVGTDITAGSATLVEIETDGIYAVTVEVQSNGAGLYVSLDSNPPQWDSFQAAGAANGAQLIAAASRTYYIADGQSFAVGVNGAEGDSISAYLTVQRVA